MKTLEKPFKGFSFEQKQIHLFFTPDSCPAHIDTCKHCRMRSRRKAGSRRSDRVGESSLYASANGIRELQAEGSPSLKVRVNRYALDIKMISIQYRIPPNYITVINDIESL